MRKLIVITLPIVFACSLFAHAGNWERFRGPNGTGIAPDNDIPVKFDDKEGILWKLPIGPGHSSPIVWEKYLFLQTSSAEGNGRFLVCIDVTKGKELWSRGIPAAKAPIHYRSSLASATPATDGQAVYIPFWNGKNILLAAYNFKGDLLWNKDLGPFVSQHGAGASPILYKDKLILANDMDHEDPKTKKPVTRPSTLLAFNKKTGDLIWETPREAFRTCYSAPFLMEKPGAAPELIVTSSTSIASYNPDDGTQNWKWACKFPLFARPLRTIGAPLVVGDMMFACSGDGNGDRWMWAMELDGTGTSTKTKQTWNNRKDFPYVPCVLNKGAHLYFVNDNGYAGCYEANTGKRVWYERLPDTHFSSSPVMIGDKIYAASEEGDLYVFAASTTYTPLAKNHLGELVRASLAVADGRLYVRGQNHLFCIGKK